MGIISLIMKKSQKHFMAQQAYLGHVNGHVEEMYSSHVVIKAFNKEKSLQKPLISTTIHFINLLGNHNLCQAF